MSKLQELRLNKNFSQSQLAKNADVNYRMLQHYEAGSNSIDGAKIETLAKLAKALGCKIWEVLESSELQELVKSVC